MPENPLFPALIYFVHLMPLQHCITNILCIFPLQLKKYLKHSALMVLY